jgi:putative ABC transport system permease protein
MKGLLSIRLAWSGIGKNRKLYLPYCLTIIGMVMMSYIMQALSYAPALHAMKGGSNLEAILSLGKLVIAVFAGIFLLYTNSFLIRRRYREFGLYNVLGMDKNALCRVAFWENLIVAVIGLAVGLALGTLLYKLAELGLVNMVQGQVDDSFMVEPESLKFTLVIFAVIFALIMIRSLIQVRHTRPLELLRSESAGEKPPRANYLLGFLGLALLGGAYDMAVTISNTLSAFTWFFVAVLMVIAGTYLVMISGSVVLCRLLQKWKGYYYKKQHFVSVSSMAYRMKRNGAGLASICILATMVLVMISSTGSLYIGAEDAIAVRYPYDSTVKLYFGRLDELDDRNVEKIQRTMERALEAQKVTPTAEKICRYVTVSGALLEDRLVTDYTEVNAVMNYNQVYSLYLLSQADYNRMYGTDIALQPGQAMVQVYNGSWNGSHIQVGALELDVVGQLPCGLEMEDMTLVPSLVLVVSDLQQASVPEECNMIFSCGYDFGLPEEETLEAHRALEAAVKALASEQKIHCRVECPIVERQDFYITFGGLFFIGMMLSAMFVAAAALIIYYKQVSEGYEDQSRFAIMRKVGMTQRDIKKSINSQILTVFFIPLLMAGVHLAFAFPLVWQLLTMFSLTNKRLAICTNIGAFLIFCVFYVVIYRFTAHAYYRIVSESERK